MATRGRAQKGRTGQTDPTEPTRAQAVLKPGELVRKAYDHLVAAGDISAAEVVREGILTLYEQRTGNPRTYLQEAG
jgi:hypothetical protein